MVSKELTFSVENESWWHAPIIPAQARQRQKSLGPEISLAKLVYLVNSRLRRDSTSKGEYSAPANDT